MIVKQFTDEKYVAMSDIMNLSSDIVTEIKQYRQSFLEMVAINDLDFVNIIETPSLVKKRFIKNVELKGHLDLQLPSSDYILEIAKMIVDNKDVPGVIIKNKDALIKKYLKNNKDLTIVTNYLINNIKHIEHHSLGEHDIGKAFPELSQMDIDFIHTYNDVNLSYSISDYQKKTSCSYETGRKSLERMTDLKFYSKEKIGKKFVYKPTNKLQDIMKGGM